jgi:HlyD family secretion protein
MSSCSRVCSIVLVGLAVLFVVAGDGPGQGPAPGDRSKKAVAKPSVRATGTLVPEEVIEIGTEVNGKIIAFGPDLDDPRKPIDYNSRVKVGTVLAKIDDTLYAADAAIAKADLAMAEAELKRSEWELALVALKLKRKTDPELDALAFKAAEANQTKARAGVDKAREALKKATFLLESCTIKSPTDGVVLDRRTTIGQGVVTSLTATSLFLIAKDLKRMQVLVTVAEADISRVRVGQKASFKVDARPGEVFSGTVLQVRLNATLANNRVTYTAVVETRNDNLKLLPYLTADVEFAAGR